MLQRRNALRLIAGRRRHLTPVSSRWGSVIGARSCRHRKLIAAFDSAGHDIVDTDTAHSTAIETLPARAHIRALLDDLEEEISRRDRGAVGLREGPSVAQKSAW